MSEEKKQFVLYDYLRYFWQKKIWFLIIPLVITVLVYGAIQVVKDTKKYVGESQVFVGKVNIEDLTNPINIKNKFKDTKNELTVYVAEKQRVKFTVRGDDEASVKKELEEITDQFKSELDAHSQERVETSYIYLDSLEVRIKDLKDTIKIYREKLEKETAISIGDNLVYLLDSEERQLSEATSIANRMRSDLVFYEEPELLTIGVHAAKTYMKESIAIGVALGLFMTVLLLMLTKYISDARRYYNHD